MYKKNVNVRLFCAILG